MTDPSAWLTTTYDEGTRRWLENMSATGRRQATSVAASKGRQWVNRTIEDRPSRGEIRAWFELVLDERRGLHNRVEALVKENEALTAQRDVALEDLAAERAAHDADIADLGDHRDTLKVMLRQAQCERDRLRAQLLEAREDPARSGYVILRLRDGQPETVMITNWEESDGGEVHVDGYRTRVQGGAE